MVDGWNTFSFPFGALNGLFSGANLLLVSGSFPWFGDAWTQGKRELSEEEKSKKAPKQTEAETVDSGWIESRMETMTTGNNR